ncbi:FecR domain-containing protein [Thermodesulfobacteriota bacterium]
MKHFKTTLYLSISMVFFCLLPCQAIGASIGKITFLQGNVDITKPEEKAQKVKTGDGVYEKDIIRTKSNAKCEITFNDSNILRIAGSSRVAIESYFIEEDDKDTIFNLSRGNIQNIVKKKLASLFGSKSRRKFEVHTKTAVVGVRGTDFFTYYTKGISGATFKEGSGYCYNLQTPDQIYLIQPGETFILTGPDIQPVLRPATSSEISIREQSTSPTEKDRDASGVDSDTGISAVNADTGFTPIDVNTGISDIVRGTAVEEDIKVDNQRLLEKGIDDRLQTIDRIEEQRIDIPQTVPGTDQMEPYH